MAARPAHARCRAGRHEGVRTARGRNPATTRIRRETACAPDLSWAGAGALTYAPHARENLPGEHRRCGRRFELVEAEVAGSATVSAGGLIAIAEILGKM